MPFVQLISNPIFSEPPVARKKKAVEPAVKPAVKKKKPRPKRETTVAIGIDLSTSSISGAAFGYDRTLDKEVGPVFDFIRWEREHDYFKRMGDLSRGADFILRLIGSLNIYPEIDDIHIAIEEPWPFGMQKRMESNSLKQQAQMSGVFIGALLKWGYERIYEIHNQWWRGIIAEDLGITTHWSKYGKGSEGKMRSKEWALKTMSAPDWPDLIQHSKRGLISRPEGSRAKAIQPDDRYDALAIAVWMRREIENSSV